MNIYEIHQKMTAHLFPAYSNEDERFLSLALCGEVAELVEMLDNPEFSVEAAREETADIRIYLELLAKRFDVEGDKLIMPSTFDDLSEGRLLLGLARCTGLIANLIKKRWRDGADLTELIRGLLYDTRGHVEQVAYRLGIEGDKLNEEVLNKLRKVAEKHKDRLHEVVRPDRGEVAQSTGTETTEGLP